LISINRGLSGHSFPLRRTSLGISRSRSISDIIAKSHFARGRRLIHTLDSRPTQHPSWSCQQTQPPNQPASTCTSARPSSARPFLPSTLHRPIGLLPRPSPTRPHPPHRPSLPSSSHNSSAFTAGSGPRDSAPPAGPATSGPCEKNWREG
jgi:hypothetical protein